MWQEFLYGNTGGGLFWILSLLLLVYLLAFLSSYLYFRFSGHKSSSAFYRADSCAATAAKFSLYFIAYSVPVFLYTILLDYLFLLPLILVFRIRMPWDAARSLAFKYNWICLSLAFFVSVVVAVLPLLRTKRNSKSTK